MNLVVSKKRHVELDALRGVAVLLMVVYHFFFNLSYFYGFNIAIRDGWWTLFARGTASLFLLLVGISFVLSWKRTPTKYRLQKTLRRSAILLGGAMIISLVTWLTAGDAFVKFGILHLIGTSVLLQPFMYKLHYWNLPLGITLFFLGIFTSTLNTQSILLFPFGIIYDGFQSLDYYPLLPWFGIVMIGMALGEIFYVPKPSSYLRFIHSLPYPTWLIWTGKNALLLYFIHQPILLVVLILILGIPT